MGLSIDLPTLYQQHGVMGVLLVAGLFGLSYVVWRCCRQWPSRLPLRLRRWLYFRGSECRALGEPREIRSSGDQAYVLTESIAKRQGTVSLWVKLPKVGVGARRPGEYRKFLFASSCGYMHNGNGRVRHGFALSRFGENEHRGPAWVFDVSNGRGEATWALEVPDRADVLPDGWQHIALGWNAASGKQDAGLWISGSPAANLQGKMAECHPDVAGPVPMVIGTWVDLERWYFIGAEMAWFAVFPNMLEPRQVAKLHRLGPPS